MGKKGIPNKKKMVRLGTKEKKEIVKMAKMGIPYRKIGELYNVKHPAVVYWLKVDAGKVKAK